MWHDDVRPPPKGWVWARTNERAKELLSQRLVTEISMDHDLGLHVLESDVPAPGEEDYWDKVIEIAYATNTEDAETGLDLVEWMILKRLVPAKVTIHSWNPSGAMMMATRLANNGHEVVVEPFDPKRREREENKLRKKVD